MARPIRVEFEGAIYHVTARGKMTEMEEGMSVILMMTMMG